MKQRFIKIVDLTNILAKMNNGKHNTHPYVSHGKR